VKPSHAPLFIPKRFLPEKIRAIDLDINKLRIFNIAPSFSSGKEFSTHNGALAHNKPHCNSLLSGKKSS